MQTIIVFWLSCLMMHHLIVIFVLFLNTTVYDTQPIKWLINSASYDYDGSYLQDHSESLIIGRQQWLSVNNIPICWSLINTIVPIPMNKHDKEHLPKTTCVFFCKTSCGRCRRNNLYQPAVWNHPFGKGHVIQWKNISSMYKHSQGTQYRKNKQLPMRFNSMDKTLSYGSLPNISKIGRRTPQPKLN